MLLKCGIQVWPAGMARRYARHMRYFSHRTPQAGKRAAVLEPGISTENRSCPDLGQLHLITFSSTTFSHVYASAVPIRGPRAFRRPLEPRGPRSAVPRPTGVLRPREACEGSPILYTSHTLTATSQRRSSSRLRRCRALVQGCLRE